MLKKRSLNISQAEIKLLSVTMLNISWQSLALSLSPTHQGLEWLSYFSNRQWERQNQTFVYHLTKFDVLAVIHVSGTRLQLRRVGGCASQMQIRLAVLARFPSKRRLLISLGFTWLNKAVPKNHSIKKENFFSTEAAHQLSLLDITFNHNWQVSGHLNPLGALVFKSFGI